LAFSARGAREKPDDPKALRATLELADRMAPLLAYSANVNGNPRIIKRMLNVVRMRASVARRRKMELDESVIAKLALWAEVDDTSILQTGRLARYLRSPLRSPCSQAAARSPPRTIAQRFSALAQMRSLHWLYGCLLSG
jgi:hypothetical protein